MKKFFICFLCLLILPIFVNAESKYLYDVIKEEAESGGLAKEYTGEHQDTVDNSGTDKIYYYHASNNEEANSIINKRNVLFGGYCWEMIRTTDSRGVRLLFNGSPSNGKCYGNYPYIGYSNFTIYDNLNSLGSAGYMYNDLYPTSYTFSPNLGSYSVSGQTFSESDYGSVSISESRESNTTRYYSTFSFSSSGWKNVKNSNNYSTSGTISFSVLNRGNYAFDYDYRDSSYYDRVKIYKNDSLIDTITLQKTGTIPFGELSSSDVIKVELDVRGSRSIDTLIFNMKKVTGTPVDSRAYFGNRVSYSNGRYTLVDTIRSDGSKDLSYNHYYCLDGSSSCEEVYYTLSWYYPDHMDSFKLTNGMTIEKFVHDQLYDDNVNQKDSALKQTIDNWYQYNFVDYTKYLEDTVFCQNRNFAYEDVVTNPNGGNSSLYFYRSGDTFNDAYESSEIFLYNTNLKCNNVTDRFSTMNEKAKLTYPVATINYAEALLMFSHEYDSGDVSGSKVRGFTNSSNNFYTNNYWLLSPHAANSTYGWAVATSGGFYYSYGSNQNAVRPMVSLKKGVKFKFGDGSKEHPYEIAEFYSIGVEIVDETKDLNIDIEDLTQVVSEEEVTFKVTPIKGYQLNSLKIVDEDNNEIDYSETGNKNEYTFIMPDTNVTIIPSYEKVKNSVNVEDNKNTKVIVIEVNDSKAVVYEDIVKFHITPEEGYEVDTIEITDSEGNKIECKKTKNENEYEFIMPDSDVLITPIYRKIENSNDMINPQTGNTKIIIFMIILLSLIGFLYSRKKHINQE